MILDNNLEIFKENKLIEKLAGYFSSESINLDSEKDYFNELAKLFIFKKQNEFGEGKNILTRYEIQSIENPDKQVYLNIAKSSYNNEKNVEDKLLTHTDTSFILHSEEPVIYDIMFFTSPNALEQSHFHYFDKLTDYDRVLNPQYYQERQDHVDFNDYSDEEDIIDLNPEQQYQSIFKNNVNFVLNKLNEQFDEDKKIEFNQTETLFPKNKMIDVLELLEVTYMKPDVLAETTDGLKEETYIFLWNNLVKFNETMEELELNIKKGKDELTVADLWDFIPEKHQRNIIESLSEIKDLKLKNGIVLSSITPKNIFGEITKEEEALKIYMVHSKDTTENHITKVFKDKEEGNKHFKIHSYEKRNERLPF